MLKLSIKCALGNNGTISFFVGSKLLQNYQEALRYIGRLPFEQAESNMKRYGKTLMLHVPEDTTLLLKGLCTDYHPSQDSSDRDHAGRASINTVRGKSLLILVQFYNLHGIVCELHVTFEMTT